MGSELMDRRQPSYSPKTHNQSWSRLLPYLLRQQRLLFLLLGIAIATSVFTLLPSSSSTNTLTHVVSVSDSEFMSPHPVSFNMGGKIPLGLKPKGLRIVVTSGAGFVGSHLVDRLIARGDSVIVVDNFITGNKDNVMHHFGNPRFELIRHDVVEPLLLEVDQIYHLACPASPVHYKFNPVKTIISLIIK
ncbi:hypothetical protein R6Q57_007154 [Mikania cordata]